MIFCDTSAAAKLYVPEKESPALRIRLEGEDQVLVSDLMEVTRQNQALLQATVARARKQLDGLGEAGRNLKRLRRAYGYIPASGRVG